MREGIQVAPDEAADEVDSKRDHGADDASSGLTALLLGNRSVSDVLT
jgi:hypothetical protein